MQQLAHRLTLLSPESCIRSRLTELLREKLYDLGIIPYNSTLSQIEQKVTVSAFARRRLAVVLTRLHMAETVKTATRFIETGEVRVGVESVTDLSYLVSRGMEDHITWSFGSKIKRNLLRYRRGYDDLILA